MTTLTDADAAAIAEHIALVNKIDAVILPYMDTIVGASKVLTAVSDVLGTLVAAASRNAGDEHLKRGIRYAQASVETYARFARAAAAPPKKDMN